MCDEDERVRSLASVAYVVLGVLVASQHDCYAHLTTVSQVASAVVATVLWPLILFGACVGVLHDHAGPDSHGVGNRNVLRALLARRTAAATAMAAGVRGHLHLLVARGARDAARDRCNEWAHVVTGRRREAALSARHRA
jgi:hypothetical protein